MVVVTSDREVAGDVARRRRPIGSDALIGLLGRTAERRGRPARTARDTPGRPPGVTVGGPWQRLGHDDANRLRHLCGAGLACHDCVVTVLLGPPPELTFDDDERRALDVLAEGGLVPPLRLVQPIAGPVVESA